MSKINKVIFFLNNKFSKRDYHRFGFDIIKKRGYDVEAWDFTPIINPKYSKLYTPPDFFEYNNCFIFHEIGDARTKCLSLTSKDVIINFIDYPFLKKLKLPEETKIGSLILGLIPNPKIGYHEYFIKIIQNPKSAFSSLKRNFLRKFNYFKPINFLVIGGANAKKDLRYVVDQRTDVIKAHSLDYDCYLESQQKNIQSNVIKNRNFAVYLDEDMTEHPDYLHQGIPPHCTADKFFPEINKFFFEFEKKTGLEIIIAAHPRSNFSKDRNPFPNHKIVFGKTIELVKKSKLTFAHMSTSMNFSVFYNKPIILLDSNQYSKTLRNYIGLWSSKLDLEVINISIDWPLSIPSFKSNQKVYNRYKNNYIKEQSTPEKFVWEIFCDYLEKI